MERKPIDTNSFLSKKNREDFCFCPVSNSIYEDTKEGIKYQYTFKSPYIKNKSKPIDILILSEFLEPVDRQTTLTKKLFKYLQDFNFAILPALGCTPSDFLQKKDVVAIYTNCKKKNIDEKIREFNPKVIITLGKAVYTITESKQLPYDEFFINVNGKHIRKYTVDDTWFFSSEYNCKVFPCPPIYQWITPKGSEKDVYETLFTIEQIERAKKEINIPAKRKTELIYTLIENPNEFLNKIIEDKEIIDISIDTESEGLNPFKDKLISIQFAWNNHHGYYLKYKDIDKNLLIKLFSTKKKFIMHNGIYDGKVLKINGIYNVHCDFDVLLAVHQCNENISKKLKALTWRYTPYGGYEKEMEEYKKKYKIKTFTDVPETMLIKYGCTDAIITYQLYLYFKNRLEEEDPEVKKNFYDYVMPAVDMMIDLESSGVQIDIKYLKEYNEVLLKKEEELKDKIFKLAGKEFNIGSKDQLSEVLIEKYDIKKTTENTTKEDNLKCDVDSLESYANEYDAEIAKLVTEYNHVSKEISQFGIKEYQNSGEIKGFLQSVIDNRLYASYKLHGTTSGRMSGGKDKQTRETISMSSDFGINFQNIPKTPEFRKVFLAPKNYVFSCADFSSMEVTIQSQMCGHGTLEDMILNGKDMHCITGAAFCKLKGKNISYEEFLQKSKIDKIKEYSDLRDLAKIINFSCQYGATKYGLSYNLKIDKDEAQEYLNTYMNTYPEIKKFIEKQHRFAKEYGYVKSALGKKRRLPQLTYMGNDSYINHKNGSSFEVSNILNNSTNFPIQSASGQITIIAMTEIWKEFKEKNLKSKVIINVHDEICFYVHLDEIEIVKEIVERLMKKKRYDNVGGNTLELDAEMEIGDVWKYTKSVDYWKEHKEEYNKWTYAINKRNMENENLTIEYLKKDQKNIKVEQKNNFDNFFRKKKMENVA